jgi:putative transposase
MPDRRRSRRRREGRLQGFDYSSPGGYFITHGIQYRHPILGHINSGVMILSDFGFAVREIWRSMEMRFFGHVRLDAFIIMPDHFHGILFIGDGDSPGTGPGAWHPIRIPIPDMQLPDNFMPMDLHDYLPALPSNSVLAAPDISVPAAPDRLAPAAVTSEPETGPNPLDTSMPVRMNRRPADTKRPTLGDIVGAFKSITTLIYIRGVREQGWPPFSRRIWERDYYDHIVRNEADLQRIRRYILNNPIRYELRAKNRKPGKSL